MMQTHHTLFSSINHIYVVA